MSQLKGFATKVGVVKGSVWGTPVLLAANHQVAILSEGMGAQVQLIEDDQLHGSDQRRAGDKGNEFYAGDIVCAAKYETLGLLWALFYGTAVAPVQQGLDTAYLHALRVKAGGDMSGTFGTMGMDYVEEIHEYPSFKVAGWRYECNAAEQFAKVTFRIVADALNRNTSSGINTQATFASVTMFGARNRLFFKDGVFRMNDASGAGLGTGDKQFLTGFAIEMSRPYKVDDITLQRGFLIDEPIQDGFTEGMLEMTFSKFATDNVGRLGEMLAKTKKKADVVITNGIANGATNYKNSFFLNDIQFGEGKPVIGGPGLTPWTLRASLHAVAASPTGFPAGYTDMCQQELINTRPTGLLS